MMLLAVSVKFTHQLVATFVNTVLLNLSSFTS